MLQQPRWALQWPAGARCRHPCRGLLGACPHTLSCSPGRPAGACCLTCHRPQALLGYLHGARQQLLRAAATLHDTRKLPPLTLLVQPGGVLDVAAGHARALTTAADELVRANGELRFHRLPLFNVPDALDVLSTGAHAAAAVLSSRVLLWLSSSRQRRTPRDVARSPVRAAQGHTRRSCAATSAVPLPDLLLLPAGTYSNLPSSIQDMRGPRVLPERQQQRLLSHLNHLLYSQLLKVLLAAVAYCSSSCCLRAHVRAGRTTGCTQRAHGWGVHLLPACPLAAAVTPGAPARVPGARASDRRLCSAVLQGAV